MPLIPTSGKLNITRTPSAQGIGHDASMLPRCTCLGQRASRMPLLHKPFGSLTL